MKPLGQSAHHRLVQGLGVGEVWGGVPAVSGAHPAHAGTLCAQAVYAVLHLGFCLHSGGKEHSEAAAQASPMTNMTRLCIRLTRRYNTWENFEVSLYAEHSATVRAGNHFRRLPSHQISEFLKRRDSTGAMAYLGSCHGLPLVVHLPVMSYADGLYAVAVNFPVTLRSCFLRSLQQPI